MKRLSLIAGDFKAVLLLVAFVAVGVTMTVFSSGDSGGGDTLASDSVAFERRKNAPFQRNFYGDGSRSADSAGVEGSYYGNGTPQRKLFPFDPNTADSTQLLSLGLQPWQVRNIYKYRSRGGIYRKKEDFARLYGLTVEHYRALEPYIRISGDYLPASTLIRDSAYRRDTLRFPQKLKPSERIVLNTADTAALKKVPGIGSGFARMIIAHGERLGGYVDVCQLDEIDGFPAESKQYFVVQNPNTLRLNLNTLSLSVLKCHPYIGFHRAKTIVDYRNRYGRIDSLEQLRLDKDFTPDVIERLRPYVEY